MLVSVRQILRAGSRYYGGTGTFNKWNIRQYNGFFIANPFISLTTYNKIYARFRVKLKLHDFFMVLHFLKSNANEQDMKQAFGYSNKTYRKKRNEILRYMENLGLIVWESRLDGALPSDNYLATVDTTDFETQEMKGYPGNPFFSYKFHGPALRYQIGIGIRNGLIACADGPFPPGLMNDLTIARNTILQRLRPGEKVLADNIYQDHRVIMKGKPGDPNYLTRAQILARHEVINGRVKKSEVLSGKFRHKSNFSFHRTCFFAVLNLVQLGLMTDSPLPLENFVHDYNNI